MSLYRVLQMRLYLTVIMLNAKYNPDNEYRELVCLECYDELTDEEFMDG